MFRLFRSTTAKSAKAAPATRKAVPSVRPTIEALEDRLVMSTVPLLNAVIQFDGGKEVLQITQQSGTTYTGTFTDQAKGISAQVAGTCDQPANGSYASFNFAGTDARTGKTVSLSSPFFSGTGTNGKAFGNDTLSVYLNEAGVGGWTTGTDAAPTPNLKGAVFALDGGREHLQVFQQDSYGTFSAFYDDASVGAFGTVTGHVGAATGWKGAPKGASVWFQGMDSFNRFIYFNGQVDGAGTAGKTFANDTLSGALLDARGYYNTTGTDIAPTPNLQGAYFALDGGREHLRVQYQYGDGTLVGFYDDASVGAYGTVVGHVGTATGWNGSPTGASIYFQGMDSFNRIIYFTGQVNGSGTNGQTFGSDTLSGNLWDARGYFSSSGDDRWYEQPVTLEQGNLYIQYATKTLIESGVQSYTVGSLGGSTYVFYLTSSGALKSYNGSSSTVRDTGVRSFALGTVDGAATLVDLKTWGSLSTSTGGAWVFRMPGIQSFSFGSGTAANALYGLGSDGTLWKFASGSSTIIDRMVYWWNTPFASTDTSVTDWFSFYLSDAGVRGVVRSDFARDGVLTRNDMLDVFDQVLRDGTVSAAESQDLQALLAYADTLSMPGYVRNLTAKVLNPNASDLAWLALSGVGGTVSAQVYNPFGGGNIGNSGAAATAAQFRALVNEWFRGQVDPSTYVDLDTKTNGIEQWGSFSYLDRSASKLPLFASGVPTFLDVRQGGLGDCWLLASLAEVAARQPTTIEDMFTDNGDGTFTVRFYKNGQADYVTVDQNLPSGFASADTSLWVALAEKAYTQEFGSYRYQSINGGWPDTALTAITGVQAGRITDISNAAYAMQHGGLVALCTGGSVNSSSIITHHCYALVGYNPSSSQPFEVYNPWGTDDQGYVWDGSPYYGHFTADANFLSANFSSMGWGAAAGSQAVAGTSDITPLREPLSVFAAARPAVMGPPVAQPATIFKQEADAPSVLAVGKAHSFNDGGHHLQAHLAPDLIVQFFARDGLDDGQLGWHQSRA